MMRRLTKEELYRFDGTPLFPEPRAYTANYSLSPLEADLYQAVTTYVREEMNRADRTCDNNRRSSVGFALQILQRRLASSPAAIHRSLERRRKRLEERLRQEMLMRQPASTTLIHVPVLPSYDLDEMEEAPGEEAEAVEEQILDSATAAQRLQNSPLRSRSSRISKNAPCASSSRGWMPSGESWNRSSMIRSCSTRRQGCDGRSSFLRNPETRSNIWLKSRVGVLTDYHPPDWWHPLRYLFGPRHARAGAVRARPTG
jgi:hypothetical protein